MRNTRVWHYFLVCVTVCLLDTTRKIVPTAECCWNSSNNNLFWVAFSGHKTCSHCLVKTMPIAKCFDNKRESYEKKTEKNHVPSKIRYIFKRISCRGFVDWKYKWQSMGWVVSLIIYKAWYTSELNRMQVQYMFCEKL